MLQLLAPDGVAHDRLELRVGGARAHRLAQVGLMQREQAGAQLALGGQADAVAVGAERLGHRVDEPDLAFAVGEAEHARGGRRLARQLLKRVDGSDDLAQLLARQHGVGRPRVVAVEGANSANGIASSSVNPRIATAFTLIECTSGYWASASRPRSTCGRESRRVIWKKRSRCSESI